jgi:hypothetical protein
MSFLLVPAPFFSIDNLPEQAKFQRLWEKHATPTHFFLRVSRLVSRSDDPARSWENTMKLFLVSIALLGRIFFCCGSEGVH